MSLKLNAPGGGSVTLQEPTTASNVTLNLPAETGTVIYSNASGNVGVGTTSPPNYSGYTTIAVNNATNGGIIDFNSNGARAGTIIGDNAGLIVASVGSRIVRFDTNGSERARIDANGKLSVGTTSAAATLTVDAVNVLSAGVANTYAISCGNVLGDDLAFGSDNSFSYIQSFNNKPLLLNQQGNEVRVCGTADNGAFNLQCNFTGVWGAGAYVNGSDERIKEDIAPITSGLDVVTKLNPVTYRYKENWSKDRSIQTGFIAQELLVAMEGNNYVEGIVQQGGSEGYYSVAYQNIIPLLTKAIQEQQAMIEELKAKVAALEAK